METAPAVDQWQELRDPESGRPYYHNAATNTTTWDRPPALPVAVQSIHPAPVVGIPAATYAGEMRDRPRKLYADIACCFSCSVPDLTYEDGSSVYEGAPSEEPIDWPTGFLYGYCCWQDPRRHRSICCPSCFPCATLCPCSIMGSSMTLMREESYLTGCGPCCEDQYGCQMGPSGNSVCLALSIFGFLPFGVGALCVLGTVCAERRFVMQRHNVRHKDNCCCWMLGCFWPCAVMQHYILLRSFNHERGIQPLSHVVNEQTPFLAGPAVPPVLAVPV